MNKNYGDNKQVLGLYEAFAQQHKTTYGGHRGSAYDIAIPIDAVRHNERDVDVTLRDGTVRSIPYYLLNRPQVETDRWIAAQLGDDNLDIVRSQLATV